MATALTLKQAIAAVWQKFMGVIGYADISGIGDGTVTGALVGLNGKFIWKKLNLSNQWTGEKISFENIDFNEMIVFISFGTSDSKWYSTSFNLPPKSVMDSTDVAMIGGHYFRSSDCSSFSITYNNTGISAAACTLNGNTGYTPNLMVYYR